MTSTTSASSARSVYWAKRRPIPPQNLLGDYAGGALFLALGVLAALIERGVSGRGQVVDAAIVDSAASLMAPLMGLAAMGMVDLDWARNMIGGPPHYRTYRCADSKYLAVGPLEPKFRRMLYATLGIDAPDDDSPDSWEEETLRVETIFAARPRDVWTAAFTGSDACVTPVLSLDEAPLDPHLRARGSFVAVDGQV